MRSASEALDEISGSSEGFYSLKMECLIADARDAVIVLHTVLDSLNGCRAKGALAKDGYTVLYLTEDQDRALFAAMSQAYASCRELEEGYFASAELARKKPPKRKAQ